jgi:hypothetical protein
LSCIPAESPTVKGRAPLTILSYHNQLGKQREKWG